VITDILAVPSFVTARMISPIRLPAFDPTGQEKDLFRGTFYQNIAGGG
jgi:hypothetical protein